MIVVVGAGPAGLATAYYLQQRGLSYQVLERDNIGHAWRNHYDRLHLHTLKQVSHLPGAPMPADYPAFPSAAQFHAYLAAYAQRFRLNITTGVAVEHARWSSDGWHIETSQGSLSADKLMAATGIWSMPYCPEFAGIEQFGGTIMHSRDYRNAEPFQGKRVLVIGTGNSGTEIAVDVRTRAVTTGIAVRDGTTFAPYPTSAALVRMAAWLLGRVPRALGEAMLRRVRRNFDHLGLYWPATPLLETYPVVGYELPEAVEANHIAVYPGIRRFVPGGVQFDDDREVPFDAVIFATGYRPATHFIAEDITLDQSGRPVVDRFWRSVRNPNLFCVGYWYPATEGWLQTIGRVAQQAVRAV